jgi:hypothetical protein
MINDEGKEEMVYQVAYTLVSMLETNEPPKVSVGSTSGKIDIVFKKVEESSTRFVFSNIFICSNGVTKIFYFVQVGSSRNCPARKQLVCPSVRVSK